MDQKKCHAFLLLNSGASLNSKKKNLQGSRSQKVAKETVILRGWIKKNCCFQNDVFGTPNFFNILKKSEKTLFFNFTYFWHIKFWKCSHFTTWSYCIWNTSHRKPKLEHENLLLWIVWPFLWIFSFLAILAIFQQKIPF